MDELELRDSGKLYICPTPIGNLEDITLRVIRILGEVDVIAAEDTRHTLKLLNHLGIRKKLISYHGNNLPTAGRQLLRRLEAGERIALVSDAGMPGISDPGEKLVKACIEAAIPIEVLPGASAFVVALVGSGLSTEAFTFIGFLGHAQKEMRLRLEALQYTKQTLIFYEAPHRVLSTLEMMYRVLGERQVALCRELTKKHEAFVRKPLSAFLEDPISPRGEYVIVVEGFNGEVPTDSLVEREEAYQSALLQALDAGERLKTASEHIAQAFGKTKNTVYQDLLTVKQTESEV